MIYCLKACLSAAVAETDNSIIPIWSVLAVLFLSVRLHNPLSLILFLSHFSSCLDDHVTEALQ